MNKLVRLQLRNVFHNKLFYVCLGLNLLMSPIMSFIGSLVVKTNPPKVFSEIITFISSEVGIISTIFIALFCCFNFNDGTTKNIIARGYTRLQLLFSKYIACLVGLFVMYIITALVIFVLFAKNGIGFESNMSYLLLNASIEIIAFTIFFATMSFILEKNGSAIIACLIVPNIIPLLLGLIDAKMKTNISDFWLSSLSNKIIANPTLGTLGLSALYYLIYIVLFVIIGAHLLKRKEIK